MKSFLIFISGLILLVSVECGTALAYRIDNVPAYKWYHGCGPTAAASILGYYDNHEYNNLFDPSGWRKIRKTKHVKDHISSPAHNARYDPTPDAAEFPDAPDTSIADFFHTSEDPLHFGWSYITYADDAFSGYAAHRGYAFDALTLKFKDLAWSYLVSEIDAGHPMLFLVDSNGDNRSDHFVPVLGYRDRGKKGRWYGLYTTWTEREKIVWKRFRPISSAYRWGVGYATVVQPATKLVIAVPESLTWLYLLVGLSCLGATKTIFKPKQKEGGRS